MTIQGRQSQADSLNQGDEAGSMDKSRRLEFTGQNTRRENSLEHGDLQGISLEYSIKD